MPAALPADWPAIKALAQQGVSLSELSKQTGIALGTLKARSKREGWQAVVAQAEVIKQERVQVAVSTGQMQPRATDATGLLQNTLKERLETTKLGMSRYVERMATHAAEAATLEDAQNVKHVASIMAQVWPEASGSGGNVMVNVLVQG